MKILLLTLFAICGYCASVPASENGETTYSDGETTRYAAFQENLLALLQQQNPSRDTVFAENWQNGFDGALAVECPDNQALYRIKSEYSPGHRDRRWSLSCRATLKGSTKFKDCDCKWTGKQNEFDQPLMFQCPANKVLTGAKSRHDNGREDREWEFKCCGVEDHYTRNCHLSDWINDWGRIMDHSASSSQVFTGAYSYHRNDKEDRRWKIMACDYN